jgi:DNA-binding NtrC family response regulator
VDVQILAATNSDLEKKVEKGEFRRDLYHRLQGSVLQLPLLREHAEDIPALAWYFIKKFNALYGRRIEQVAPEVFPTLKAERWDGNVRELLLKVGNAVRNCPDRTLQLKDFSLQFRPNPAAPAAGNGYYLELPYREAKEKILQEFHDAYLGHHLRQHAWNRSRTARAIGIMREQLNALARRYKLSRLRDKEPGTQA